MVVATLWIIEATGFRQQRLDPDCDSLDRRFGPRECRRIDAEIAGHRQQVDNELLPRGQLLSYVPGAVRIRRKFCQFRRDFNCFVNVYTFEACH